MPDKETTAAVAPKQPASESSRIDPLSNVVNRNIFYRDGYRALLKIGVMQTIGLLVLSGALLIMFLSVETRYVYFATTSDGRIINLVGLNEEYRSRADVISWAAGTAQKVMRFNYQDYRQHMQEVAQNFTVTGWESFTRAMKDSRTLDAVEARKLMVSMEVQSAPEIKRSFVDDNGVYTWDIQFPVAIKYEGVNAPANMETTLILRIVRVSTLQNPGGIGIEQWISTERKR